MTHGAPMAAPVNGTVPHSPWQSPVPYLFGGLAAMLGLIAFAFSSWPAPTGSCLGTSTPAPAPTATGPARTPTGIKRARRPERPDRRRDSWNTRWSSWPAKRDPRSSQRQPASRAVVELGTAATSAPGSCRCSGSGEEKKVEDDDGASSYPRLEAEAASSRSNGSSSTTALQESSQ
ncbi:hypothetical protein QOZ80_6BG0500400 [Eleusine coracana subsp. coracana]|nr:hypothetical protein QOZ80_6BG0500400 [Eleusine coracana subsp. coracana]